MVQQSKKASSQEEIPANYDDLTVSERAFDWADVSQIREKLDLTPIERLEAAQETINAAIRIRAQNGYRG